MNVFEIVKENVTARQAAEAYGLKVGRTGMACCPFHSDKSPSMKLDERYYCFGCGATGDAVDLTAKLFGIGLRKLLSNLLKILVLTMTADKSRVFALVFVSRHRNRSIKKKKIIATRC